MVTGAERPGAVGRISGLRSARRATSSPDSGTPGGIGAGVTCSSEKAAFAAIEVTS